MRFTKAILLLAVFIGCAAARKGHGKGSKRGPPRGPPPKPCAVDNIPTLEGCVADCVAPEDGGEAPACNRTLDVTYQGQDASISFCYKPSRRQNGGKKRANEVADEDKDDERQLRRMTVPLMRTACRVQNETDSILTETTCDDADDKECKADGEDSNVLEIKFDGLRFTFCANTWDSCFAEKPNGLAPKRRFKGLKIKKIAQNFL